MMQCVFLLVSGAAVCAALLPADLLAALLLLNSSPCVLICNSHLSSCLPAAFRCTPRAHLNIALCFLLPFSSFFPSCTRVEVSQLPLHQGWLVPHLGQPEQASPHARPRQTSPNLDTGWCSYCKHRTCNHVTSVHLKIWCFAASNAVF